MAEIMAREDLAVNTDDDAPAVDHAASQLLVVGAVVRRGHDGHACVSQRASGQRSPTTIGLKWSM
jgi:hypothetical protein